MSHFTVLIIGEDFEKQLAPFQENNMGDCPKHLLEFNETESEMVEEYETEGTEYIIMPDGRKLKPWDNEFRNQGTLGTGGGSHTVPDSLERKEIPFKEIYATFEEYAKDWHGSQERDVEKGVFGYWENPNAKWDWYVMGGRWAGQLKLKPGSTGTVGEAIFSTPEIETGHVDQAVKGDIELTGIQTTFAIIKDGVWYQRGKMGWWGAVSDEKPDEEWTGQWVELVLNLPDEILLTVVDCHI